MGLGQLQLRQRCRGGRGMHLGQDHLKPPGRPAPPRPRRPLPRAVWEAWTGRHAFEGLPAAALPYQVAHMGQRPPLPPGCPAAYPQLMQACWAQDPGARPGIEDVLSRLKALLGELVRGGAPDSAPVESPSRMGSPGPGSAGRGGACP